MSHLNSQIEHDSATSISCRNIGYSLAGKAILQDIECEFKAAKIHLLLGKNGAGKTTLLKLLAKELNPTNGDIYWGGESIQRLSYAEIAQQRAVLPQRQELAFSISVQQLVLFGAQAGKHQYNAKQLEDVVNQVLVLCDLQQMMHRDMLSLSGGEQQRAHIARVLAQVWPEQTAKQKMTEIAVDSFDTSIADRLKGLDFTGRWLLLDEWATALDLQHQRYFAQIFQQLSKQGLGIIMIVHDINLAWQLADNAYLLQAGCLKLQGDREAVMNEHNLQQLLDAEIKSVVDKNGERVFY